MCGCITGLSRLSTFHDTRILHGDKLLLGRTRLEDGSFVYDVLYELHIPPLKEGHLQFNNNRHAHTAPSFASSIALPPIVHAGGRGRHHHHHEDDAQQCDDKYGNFERNTRSRGGCYTV